MFTAFKPALDQPLRFPQHVLIWIRSGNGLLEVDFRTYTKFENRLIFLSPDQYIKFIAGEFEVARIEFSPAYVQRSPDYRVLFKHLISLGYIDYSDTFSSFLSGLIENQSQQILDLSVNQWYWQNPFNAQRDEYAVIFDLKELIDLYFDEHLRTDQLIAQLQYKQGVVQRLVKDRLGLTVKNLFHRKLILESQKSLAFSKKPVQEVAFDLGFQDPAYFNRFFKKKTQQTPLEFRKIFGHADNSDTFITELLQLIRENYQQKHSAAFYADRTHMSIKTLSRKVKNRLNLTVGDLIRSQIMDSARRLLEDLPVREVAFELGFKEASHFSAFFKKYGGMSPSEFQAKKYNI